MLRRVASEAAKVRDEMAQAPLSVRTLALVMWSLPFGFGLAPAETAQVVNWTMPLLMLAVVLWCGIELIGLLRNGK
jgi:hypothetical protein